MTGCASGAAASLLMHNLSCFKDCLFWAMNWHPGPGPGAAPAERCMSDAWCMGCLLWLLGRLPPLGPCTCGSPFLMCQLGARGWQGYNLSACVVFWAATCMEFFTVCMTGVTAGFCTSCVLAAGCSGCTVLMPGWSPGSPGQPYPPTLNNHAAMLSTASVRQPGGTWTILSS